MSKQVFYVQTGISLTVITFCIAMLAAGYDTGTYLPVLSGIVGYWLPSPNKDKSFQLPAGFVPAAYLPAAPGASPPPPFAASRQHIPLHQLMPSRPCPPPPPPPPAPSAGAQSPATPSPDPANPADDLPV